ncbi:hypothetical protein CXG81DRAFT_28264 [Caulochytrium protostelioides]|uniref:TspO/MBR-related protein n=2 Tax=Caulochytrium protostelioides TaxID=1555241 RepID=A0A4P9X1I3_9FUNG|nr:hypothetical protein CXG81DRAFT_28264 [Caulochytrium protostelioides]|eukprot:RKO98945.1 hypothetical protein CXG81DRAFT_28264 [Caulochytrium protostelioides]
MRWEWMGSFPPAGYATYDSKNLAWYRGIKQPSWKPPPFLFGPVWTTLYGIMGYVSYLVWREGQLHPALAPAATAALRVYAANLVCNLAWMPVFFSARQLGAATLLAWVLFGTTAALAAVFAPVHAGAGGLILPYVGWTAYAACLTTWIWRHNPGASGKSAPATPASKRH